MRRGLATLVGLALLLLSAPAVAHAAQRLETWDTTSRFVNPNAIPGEHYNRPPGTPPRPNALKVNVLLPDGYDAPANKERRYPLLLLLHGNGDAYDSWVHPQQGDLMKVAPDFPGIVVMPEGDRGFYMNAWNGGRRGGPAWENYHLDELLPMVEQRLRVAPGRKNHAIAGLSMGGEGTAYYASQRPGYFGAMASFSPPLSIQRPTFQQGFNFGTGRQAVDLWGDPVRQEFYWAGHNPIKLIPNLRHTRVYVAEGDGVLAPDELSNVLGGVLEVELRMHGDEFAAAARDKVLDFRYDPHPGIHAWRYWKRDIANAIRWGLFRDVPEDPSRWSFKTVSRTGEAWGHRFTFGQPTSVVETFSREGSRLSGDGRGDVHICAPNGGELDVSMPFDEPLPAASTPPRVRVVGRGLDAALDRGALRVRVSSDRGGKVRLTGSDTRARTISLAGKPSRTVKLGLSKAGAKRLRSSGDSARVRGARAGE